MMRTFFREKMNQALAFASLAIAVVWLFAASGEAAAMSQAEAEKASHDAVEIHYRLGKEKAHVYPELRTYSDHGIHHAELVVVKSEEAANAIDKAAEGNAFYAPIRHQELEVAALWHDTGMDGGSFRKYPDGNALRKDHSLNSAIHVLENRELIAALGVNPDAVALDCMGHSKSCSGVRDLTSAQQWTDCLNRLDAAVAEYNSKFEPIKFDPSLWTTGETEQVLDEHDQKTMVTVYKFSPVAMAQSAAAIAALRLGDANREAAAYPLTQGEETIEVDYDSYVSGAKTWQEEVSKANIAIVNAKGERTLLTNPGVDTNSYGRMYMAGEGNLSMDCVYNPKTKAVQERFRVLHGASFPLATQNCIEERLGELDTIKKLPVEARIVITGEFSRQEKKKIKRLYSRYAKDAQRKHRFPVKVEFSV